MQMCVRHNNLAGRERAGRKRHTPSSDRVVPMILKGGWCDKKRGSEWRQQHGRLPASLSAERKPWVLATHQVWIWQVSGSACARASAAIPSPVGAGQVAWSTTRRAGFGAATKRLRCHGEHEPSAESTNENPYP